MNFKDVRCAVEEIRQDTRLWLPALTERRGFSSSRTEHLLNKIASCVSVDEVYLEVGTLEGRTLEAAAHCNTHVNIVACDPESKYGAEPGDLPSNATFHKKPWQEIIDLYKRRVGCAFYDGDHSEEATLEFLEAIPKYAKGNLVVILDDWDRVSVRAAVYKILDDPSWQILAEFPHYGDGLTCPPQHFGFYFGLGILGWRSKN